MRHGEPTHFAAYPLQLVTTGDVGYWQQSGAGQLLTPSAHPSPSLIFAPHLLQLNNAQPNTNRIAQTQSHAHYDRPKIISPRSVLVELDVNKD